MIKTKSTVSCPICRSNEKYLPLPDYYRDMSTKYGFEYFKDSEMRSFNAHSCSNCWASDRERLYALWMQTLYSLWQQDNVDTSNSKMIHFAPERTLSLWLQHTSPLQYETADLLMENVDYKVDLLNLPFVDNSYDCFICSHVLEHVEDDAKAVSELYRILKSGGWGILMAPICTAIEHTLEDKSHTTEAQRWQYYGQNDHVRLYSHNDYIETIKKPGFIVNQLGIEYFGQEVFDSLGLTPTSIL